MDSSWPLTEQVLPNSMGLGRLHQRQIEFHPSHRGTRAYEEGGQTEVFSHILKEPNRIGIVIL